MEVVHKHYLQSQAAGFRPKTRWVPPPPWLVHEELGQFDVQVSTSVSLTSRGSLASPAGASSAGERKLASFEHPAVANHSRESSENASQSPGGRPASPENSQKALVNLLACDIRRGHRNVAVRHFLMLESCNAEIPMSLRAECERLMTERPKRTIDRISGSVSSWVQLVNYPVRWR